MGKMFAIEIIEGRIIPCIVCDKCKKKLLVGNGLVIWDEKTLETNTVCKGICGDNFKMGVTLEQFLFDVVINCRAGIIRKPKHKLWE